MGMLDKQWWIFTFCSGQKYGGRYVKFYGTYSEARDQMFEHFGVDWGFQYSEEEWNEYANDTNRMWEMETEISLDEIERG